MPSIKGFPAIKVGKPLSLELLILFRLISFFFNVLVILVSLLLLFYTNAEMPEAAQAAVWTGLEVDPKCRENS